MTTRPAWNNSQEFSGLTGQDYLSTIETTLNHLTRMEELSGILSEAIRNSETEPKAFSGALSSCQEAFGLRQDIQRLMGSLFTYVDSEIAISSKNSAAQKEASRLSQISARVSRATSSIQLFIARMPEDLIKPFLDHAATSPASFMIEQIRQDAAYLMQLSQEELLSSINTDGYAAWATLYRDLTSSMRLSRTVGEKTETLGWAKALGDTENEDEAVREANFHAIQEGFKTHQETFAAILNARTGFNLSVYEERSRGREPLHFLDPALKWARIERKTLDTMMDVLIKARKDSRLSLKCLAKGFQNKTLSPWNVKAPCPLIPPLSMSFDEGLEKVRESYEAVHPEMGKFVTDMVENGWLDAQEGQFRRPSAYCTSFSMTRTPRVFMNWSGSMMSARTLAHELGHAWHNWAMKDLPLSQCTYPMTLAETASIFAEIQFCHHLTQTARTETEKLETLWMEAELAVIYLINIPMRYTFEKELYERRAQGKVSPEELTEMIERHWKDWHGETVPMADSMFWAHKLHFHQVPFYNFPYSFGFLLGHAVHHFAQNLPREDFFARFNAMLCDTGRMPAEEVISRHLDMDPGQPEFWDIGVKNAVSRLVELDKLLAERR